MKRPNRTTWIRTTARALAMAVLAGLVACTARKQKNSPGQNVVAKAYPRNPISPSPPLALRPFFAWCWSTPDKKLRNLAPMLWVRNSDYWDPGKVALASRRLPRHRAAIFLWNAAPKLLASPLDTCRTASGTPTHSPSPWLSAGANQISTQMAAFFRAFKAAGGRMNYLVLDYEAGITSWQLTPNDMMAIEADPRSKELEKKLGFPYLSSAFFAGPNRRAWNLMMGSRIAKALDTAFFTPARASFPKLYGSNFGGVDMAAPYIVPDPNGHYQALSCVFGNCQSPAFYGTIGCLAYASPGGQPYGNSPFAILRYEMMYLQGVRSSSRLPVVPWVAYPSYAKTAGYYKELIYQLALRGVNQFLYWNPRGKDGATGKDDRSVNRYLAVLRRKLGTHPGVPIACGAVGWETSLLVASRRDSVGRVVYRVTIPPRTPAVEVLPGGRILDTRGRTGVWAEGKANQPLSFVAGR